MKTDLVGLLHLCFGGLGLGGATFLSLALLAASQDPPMGLIWGVLAR